MTKKWKWQGLMLGLFLGAISLSAATSCDTVEAAFDCNSVCNRYKDCFDQSYDVGGCRDRCRAGAANDDSKRAAADACQSCIDSKSCAGAAFGCATECAGIVP